MSRLVLFCARMESASYLGSALQCEGHFGAGSTFELRKESPLCGCATLISANCTHDISRCFLRHLDESQGAKVPGRGMGCHTERKIHSRADC